MKVDVHGEEHEVSHAEATDHALRFINSHFKNSDRDRPVTSIPANRARDSDMRLMAYLDAVPKLEADLARITAERDEAIAAMERLRRAASEVASSCPSFDEYDDAEDIEAGQAAMAALHACLADLRAVK